LLALACLAGCADAPVDAPPLRFSQRAGAARLAFIHVAGISSQRQLPETMGAGAAVFDADLDGDLDLYFVQSGALPLQAERAGEPPNELWLNDGGMRFSNHTAMSGDAAHRGYGMGASVGDTNGDGYEDLFVTNLGADVLLAGEPGASFRDVTGAAGISVTGWSGGAIFFDPDNDGDLDLFITGYLEIDIEHPQVCGLQREGWRSYCHPDAYAGVPDSYWLNLGDGRFRDATESAGLCDSAGKGLGAVASDLDGDGHLDIYVANDSVENRLWLGDGAGHFKDGTLLAGVGVNGLGLTEAGMGLATGDVDGDLQLDLFVTNFDDESNTLYRAEGAGLFSDITQIAGLEGSSRLSVGFGALLEDFDGDGDLDIAVANGHIIHNIELYHDGKTWAQKPLLWAGDGAGHFENVSATSGDLCATAVVGRGLYAGDLDGDGDLDLVLTECNGAARLFENLGQDERAVVLSGLPRGTLVEFHLRDGTTILREAGPQPSYFGSGSARLHFSGGAISGLDLRLPGGPSLSWPAPLAPGHYRVRLDPLELVPEPRERSAK